MDILAYLSVLLIPLFLGITILGFLTWQIIKDGRKEPVEVGERRRKIASFLFAVLFWLAFGAFYVWRTWPE